MEEGKAALLYESLSRQGLGAARFKQGLGFGGGLAANAGPVAFKKAGADFSTEIAEADNRTDNRTDAFEREWNDQESKRVVHSIAEKLGGKRRLRDEDDYVRRRTRRASSSEEERDVLRRHLNSDDRRDRESDEKDSSEQKRKDRSPSHGESSEEDRARERRIAARRGKGSERITGHEDKRRKEGGRSGREVDTKRRSRDRSRDRERGGVKDRGQERSRERGDRDHRQSRGGSHRREERLESSRDRGDRRHAERSSRRDRSHSPDRNGARNGSRKEKAKEPIDYAEIIRGYENMSAAEKLKARTKYALSQTVKKDSANGASTEWERFAFNATAPLDEDAQQDMYGDDTKAADDASHLQNTGSTFGIAKAQAVREAEKQAAHEAAIFGRPVEQTEGNLNGRKAQESDRLMQTGDSEEDEEDRPVVVMTEEKPQADGQASEQIEMDAVKPAVPSWKERALKAQQARKEAAKLAGAAC